MKNPKQTSVRRSSGSHTNPLADRLPLIPIRESKFHLLQSLGATALVATSLVLSSSPAQAVALTWDGGDATANASYGGTGTWDANTTVNWTNAGTEAKWADASVTGSDTAVFAGTAGTVTINTNLSALGLQFTPAAGGYTLGGTGILTLGNGGISATAQTSGVTTINNALSLKGGQSWTLGNGGTISVAGTVTRNVGSTVDFSTNGTFNGSGLLSAVGTTVNGWATIGGANWAVSNGTKIAAVSSYTNDTWASGNNTTVTASSAPGSGSTTNSLRFNNAGAYTVTLAGANVISSGGILVTTAVGNNLSTITGGTLQGAAGGDLVVIQNNTSNGLTIGSTIADNTSATGLTKSGAGLLTLTGTNTYSGGTTLNAGTLQIGNGSALGTGAITLNGGTLQWKYVSGNVNLSNNVVVNGTTTLDVSGGNFTMNGNISGSGSINRGASANLSLYLGGDNSGYTGTFTVQNNGNAVVRFTNANAGSANASWVFNNTSAGRISMDFGTGTISFGSMTGGGNITGNYAGTKTISAGALGLNDSFTGTITNGASGGIAALTKVGTGTMTLSGASNYTGATTVENGALVAGMNALASANGAFGNTTSAIALGDATSISSATAMNPQLLIGGAFTVARNITVGANGNALGNASTTFTIGGSTANTATFSGSTTLNQSLSVTQVAGGSLNLTGNITSGASGTQTVTLNNAGSVLASGTIGGGTGVIALTKSNTGTATISGANTYTGATNITGGTLLLNGSGAINSSSGITINGSGAKFVQTSSVANTTAITLTQGTLDGTGTVGAVTVGDGTGGIVANGNGSSTALTFNSLNFLGAGTASLHLAGGATNSPALVVTGALTTGGIVTLNLAPTISWNNGTIYNLISYGSYSGNASNFALGSTGLSGRQSGILGVSGGYITLDVEGDTPVWTGLNSQLIQYAQNSSASGNPGFALKSGHTATDFWNLDNAEFNDTYNLGSGDVAVTNGAVNIHGGDISANVLSFHNSAVDYTVSSDDGSKIAAGAITKDGSGALTISNANSYSGGTTLNAGTLNINNASAIGTGALTINGGTIDNTSAGAITLSTNNAQYWNGNFTFNGTNDLNLGTGAVNLGATRPTVTVKRGTLTVGGVISGNSGLTKSGAGTLLLAGGNNYNGGTTIDQGVVKVANATALGANTSAVSVSSGASLDLNGTTMTGQNALTLNGSGISNGGALTNSSATAATYVGLVSLGSDSSIVASNGGIILSNAGTITGSGYNLTLDGVATSSTIASIIGTGSGSVTKNGTGTWTLTGANTYSGGVTLNSGTLVVNNNAALGTGTFTTNGGTIGTTSGGTLANNIVVNGSTLFNPSNNLALNGNISGAGAITYNVTGNASSLYLNGNNSAYSGTFTGQSNANAVVRIQNANAGSANAVWVFNNASRATSLEFTAGAGTIHFGSLQGTGVITASALDTIVAGELGLNDTFAGSIQTALNLTKVGTGTMTLTGANTYTGATTVDAGELDVNGSLAAASTVGVSSGAVLGGSGTVGGIVNLNGGTLGGNGLTVAGQINASVNGVSSRVDGNVKATGGVNVSNGATLGGSGTINGTVGVNSATINGSGLTATHVTFDGNSQLTGVTTISGGITANTGSLSVKGATTTGLVTVNSGATLTGAGSVKGITVNGGGILAPGSASDTTAVTLTSTGDVNFADESSTFAIRLGVSSAKDCDVLSVSGGTVNLNNVTLSVSLGDAFFTALANNQLNVGQKWDIITNTDLTPNSLIGMFTQGESFTATKNGVDYSFLIGYGTVDNTNSDVYLQLQSVPEPSTWAMVVGGIGMLAFGRRLRRGVQD